MSRERERCEYPKCGLIRAASVHVGYGEDKHEYLGPAKAGWGSQKKALPRRSEKMEDYYRKVRRPAVAAAVGKPCQVRSPVCTGTAQTLHEPATRARSGGLVSAVAAGGEVPSCDACNGWMSRTPEGIAWATENGMLRHAPPSAKIVPRRHPPRFG